MLSKKSIDEMAKVFARVLKKLVLLPLVHHFHEVMSVKSNQIRVGYGPSPSTSMTVSWVTALDQPSPDGYSLQYSTSSDMNPSNSIVASTETYNTSDFTYNRSNVPIFTSTGTYISPQIHHAELLDLSPRTKYYYQVTTENGGRSKTHSFTTACVPGSLPSDKGPSVTVIMGDVGLTNHSRNTINAVLEHRGYADLFDAGSVEFGILVGDMSYADGNGSRWDVWGELVEPLVADFPFMFEVGNHELEPDIARHYKMFTHYKYRFRMPGDYSKEKWMEESPKIYNYLTYNFSLQYEYGASFYSYDVGLVHYVALNTYDTYCPPGLAPENCPQAKFLKNDLASVDRTITPWIVVTQHAPIYNSNVKHAQGAEAATIQFAEWAEPLFNEYNVNIVFAGHVHAYERFGHVNAEGKLDLSGKSPLYITIGDGGNHELLYDVWDESMEDISAFRNGAYYGYGTLSIFNASYAYWQWRPNPLHGSANDSVWAYNYAAAVTTTTAQPKIIQKTTVSADI